MPPPLAYPCASVPEVPEGHYGRLCPGPLEPFDGDHLCRLANEIMRDSPEKRSARAVPVERFTRIPSGYVYLGQFIDHDITRDIRTLDEAGPDVEQTLNYRTPRLDLDLLYGKDPSAVRCIYTGNDQLNLGLTLKSQGIDGRPISESLDDLPRELNGTAVVIDPRSDENLVIAQLHVLFAKFHNRVLELLTNQPALSPGPPGASLFDQARRFVTWHYQWIVANDFLPHVARKVVLDEVQQDRFRLFTRRYTPNDCPVALPVEFTVAAFRFGHSMVQNKYFLNKHVLVQDSGAIITMTKRGEGIKSRLPANYVIDWDRFFGGNPGQLNRAQVIDTYIAETLYDLPPMIIQLFRLQLGGLPSEAALRDKIKPPLPELTLRRGSKIGLPSGQEFARYFNLPITVLPEQMPARPEDEDDTEFFQASGFADRTPLWYYLLREAVTEPNRESGYGPNLPLQKLGTTGSLIVAEVLYQLLNADSESIRNAGQRWEPPDFEFGSPSRQWSLRTMAAMVEFAQSGEQARSKKYSPR